MSRKRDRTQAYCIAREGKAWLVQSAGGVRIATFLSKRAAEKTCNMLRRAYYAGYGEGYEFARSQIRVNHPEIGI